jgi:AcrR family transcriptional regulator
VKYVIQPTSRDKKRAATNARIREAARLEFSQKGYKRATIRAIAKRAQVDPSLVIQHFGSKSALFMSSTNLAPDSPEAAMGHIFDIVSFRLDAPIPPETRALFEAMFTVPEAADAVRAFLNDRAAMLADALGGEQAQLRAVLMISAVLGSVITKEFLELDAYESSQDGELTELVRQWFQKL